MCTSYSQPSFCRPPPHHAGTLREHGRNTGGYPGVAPMIVLYHAGGAGDFDLDGPSLSAENWERLRSNTARLLLKRGKQCAAALLTSIPFEISEAFNHFADEFSVLHATVPLEQYHGIGEMKAEG